jgi:1-pyrroline-5-carboxylate dehydrogenase
MALTVPEFQNEPFTDFSTSDNQSAFRKALADVAQTLGRKLPALIDGEEVTAAKTIKSTDPASPDVVVAEFPSLTKEHGEAAIQAALRAFPGWSARSAEDRARIILAAAARMRSRKHSFSALMVREVGKTWAEADADTAEAIDFLEFYAREALRYGGPQPLTPIPGEKNDLVYVPLGVGAIIPPWNFPLAILVGMASAAIVAGNTVVLKPASDSPAIGFMFADLMREVGLPPGVLNYVTGSGAVVGEHLVTHPKVRFICFTGSKEVGLSIQEKAAKAMPGQIWIKRVVAEMGGKDAIVVDGDCDLEAAVQGVLVSAFGFQGQKCSACSRAIVHERVYDRFLELLVPKVEAIRMGSPADPENFMGPVINEGSRKKALEYIEHGKKEGRLVAGGTAPAGPGWFLRPTVIADVSPRAKLAQEEIFAPVLAVIRAKDFDEALEIANGTEYGLTGAVYSNDRGHLDEAKRRFHVGNLYLNRKCTGAMVGAHPFGGFNMSGTDSKAGGRDYLLLFLQAKSIAEKVGGPGR